MANEESASHQPDHPFQPREYLVRVQQIKWLDSPLIEAWECRAEHLTEGDPVLGRPPRADCSIFFNVTDPSDAPHAGELLNVRIEAIQAEATPVEPPETP